MRVSFLEIYNEDVCDLLSSNPRSALDVREDASGGAYAKGLQAFLVKSPLEMTSVLQARRPPWAPAGRQSCCRTGCRARQQSIADALIDCKDGSYTAGGQTKSRGGRDAHESRVVALACDLHDHCRARKALGRQLGASLLPASLCNM